MTGELLKLFTPNISGLRLIPSGGGRFEIMAGDQLIYSKKATGRHAEPGEIARLLQEKLRIEPMPLEG